MRDRPFTVAMVVPTGIGARIGGHAGDATAAARLLAAACDRLIVHPNVVNASDLNGMTENMLYVEGAALDDFLDGVVLLRPCRENRVLVVCNEATPDTVNVANAARVLLGARVEVRVLPPPGLRMRGFVAENDCADGEVEGLDEMVRYLRPHHSTFDALAIHTPVDVDMDVALDYFEPMGVNSNEKINPWGGVEARVSREVYVQLHVPVAHAPVETMENVAQRVVDPRVAPEMLGGTHLFSVLRGLHQAPELVRVLTKSKTAPGPPRDKQDPRPGDIGWWDVDVLVSAMCDGPPHQACDHFNIPILLVQDNWTSSSLEDVWPNTTQCKNYLEAAGHLVAMRAGVDPAMVRRPVPRLNVHGETGDG